VPLDLKAILPKKSLVPPGSEVQRGIDRWLRDFANATVAEMQDYPPAQPWKSRPPRRGPRAGGRRTGNLGRMWGTSISYTRNSVTIVNRTRYAAYVQGPRDRRKGVPQARAMRKRGWQSVQDVAPKLAKRFKPVLLRTLRGTR